jgi:tRNA(Ile)-lysidine synthetase-like protein
MGEKGEAQFGEFRILWEMGIFDGEIHNSFNTFVLKCESMEGTVTATVRRDGDCLKLAGRSGSKKLKQLFQERKLTQPQRAVTPVLRDALGITAVYGFGIAQRCAAEIGDQVIIVHIIK